MGSGSKGDAYDTSGSGGAFSDSGSGGGSGDKVSSSGPNYATAAGSGDSSSKDKPGSEYGNRSGASGGGGDDGGNSNSNAETAPGYVSGVTQPFGQGKPKGKNITEGGFEGEANSNPEIGSEEDPGRKAEGDMQRQTQKISGATGPRQGGQSGETPYDVLGDDQNL